MVRVGVWVIILMLTLTRYPKPKLTSNIATQRTCPGKQTAGTVVSGTRVPVTGTGATTIY